LLDLENSAKQQIKIIEKLMIQGDKVEKEAKSHKPIPASSLPNAERFRTELQQLKEELQHASKGQRMFD
jgi:hypothetical protein